MSCEHHDKDATFVVQDYGPNGYVGTANVNLQHGLQPGGVITVVANTSEYMEVNVRDLAGDTLLHVVNRVSKNSFGLNSHFGGTWGEEVAVNPIPVQKGIRTVTTLVYHADGYRLFINGKEIVFYKHRSTSMPHLLHVTNCQIYKILYFTPRDVLP